MLAQAFAGVSFSLALSYNRLVLKTADARNLSNHSGASPALCQIMISWQAHFERFACRCNVIFRDRRSTLELFVQIPWQAQHIKHFCTHLKMQSEPSAHFGWVESLSQWRGAKVSPVHTWGGSNRSRCGLAHILKMQSEPSPHFGWVESLLLWRGAHFETRNVARDLSQKCRSEGSTRSVDEKSFGPNFSLKTCPSRLFSPNSSLQTFLSRLAFQDCSLQTCLLRFVSSNLSLQACLSRLVSSNLSLKTCLSRLFSPLVSQDVSPQTCLSRFVSPNLSLQTWLFRLFAHDVSLVDLSLQPCIKLPLGISQLTFPFKTYVGIRVRGLHLFFSVVYFSRGNLPTKKGV